MTEIPIDMIEALLELRHSFKVHGFDPEMIQLRKIDPDSIKKMTDRDTGELIDPDFLQSLPERKYGIRLYVRE